MVISVSVAVEGRRKFALEKETEFEMSSLGKTMEERERTESVIEVVMKGL